MSLARSLASKLAASTPIASSSSSQLFFSTSSSTFESKARRKSRLVRKNHLEAKASIARTYDAAKPDAVMGYGKTNRNLWTESTLKSILLERKAVWGEIVNTETLTEQTDGVRGAAEGGGGGGGRGEVYVPTHYNFGLTSESAAPLLDILPKVSAMRKLMEGPTVFDAAKDKLATEMEKVEYEKRDKLARIIDLRNADSRGIRVENTRRIVAAFAVKNENDTGSPEVQAAILTSRIHSLAEHCSNQPRDIHNQRPLRQLVQKRAKILKYLQRISVQRYEDCLAKIGVEARAVQGEVIVTKQAMRSLIAQGGSL